MGPETAMESGGISKGKASPLKTAIKRMSSLPESRFSLVTFLGFWVLLTGALFVLRWNSDLNFDGEVFLSAAQKFEQGRFQEGLSIYPLPLYPLLISLLYRVVPDRVIAGRLVSYGFMTLTILPIYLLTRQSNCSAVSADARSSSQK